MKRVAIIGGACSGKTTLINALKEKGFDVIEEVARQVLEERKDFPVDEVEHEIRQILIFKKMVEQEDSFLKNPPILNLIFSDRGLVDNIAYCYYFVGRVPREIACFNLTKRYDKVFCLQQLPLQKDGTRIEKDENEAKEIHERILNAYKSYGYEVVDVPIMEVEERVNFILKRIYN